MNAKEFLQSIPSKVDPKDNQGLDTALHFDFNDEQYTLEVKDGTVSFAEGLVGDPEITLKAKAEDFAKITSGEMNPMTAMMLGKLKVSNPAAMMKYAKMLGLM
ncbi:MAG: putative sterol carrier protein [Algoriphagus sp.]|jgi:putative sterol carrier protein